MGYASVLASAVVAASLFIQGCGGECSCTGAACFEGIFVRVPAERRGVPDHGLELVWVDETGSEVRVQGGSVDGWFIGIFELPGRVDRIDLRLFDADGELVEEGTYPVAWSSQVCNVCGPDCDDELVTTAVVEIATP